MRFMMLMIPAVYRQDVPPDFTPSADDVGAMGKYNDALHEAGVLLGFDGLHPPAAAARVTFPSGKPTVTDGPFAEAKEVLGGYWMIDVKSKQEAVDWAKRCPATPGDVIEIRQVHEAEDFEPSESIAREGVLREELARKRT